MNRQFTSTELVARENNELAIENAIEILKSRLDEAPQGVLNDVLKRCDTDTHQELIGWIAERAPETRGKRPPRTWSPKRNRRIWILYRAANLNCPTDPPAH